MRNCLLAGCVLALLAPSAAAQLRPLPGIPMTPPPVDHPALAGQPLFQRDRQQQRDEPVARRAGPAGPSARPMPDADTHGAKLAGRDLKKAVAKVKALKWGESLTDALAQSAATGKPVLWLQALGDIDGFA